MHVFIPTDSRTQFPFNSMGPHLLDGQTLAVRNHILSFRKKHFNCNFCNNIICNNRLGADTRTIYEVAGVAFHLSVADSVCSPGWEWHGVLRIMPEHEDSLIQTADFSQTGSREAVRRVAKHMLFNFAEFHGGIRY